MVPKDYKYTALRYIEKINSRDTQGICDLMTDDFVFVDSLGGDVSGKEAMRGAWERYFEMFPDYRITVTHMMQKENTVAILGTAAGTYAADGKMLPENAWEIPAAWKAVVRGDRIAVWRVYADNEPVRRILDKYRTK